MIVNDQRFAACAASAQLLKTEMQQLYHNRMIVSGTSLKDAQSATNPEPEEMITMGEILIYRRLRKGKHSLPQDSSVELSS